MPSSTALHSCPARGPRPRRAARARLAAAAVLLLASAAAGAGEGGAADKTDEAADADKPLWSFGGFGALGVVHASTDQADFTANVLNPGSAGYSKRWAADVDSRLGMQLGLTFNPSWSAVLQLVSERGLVDSFKPVVEWANIKYQATPDLSVRLGRIALPLFLAGDYRKASYALPWVRPPVELYGAIPISNSDGIDASYRWSAGGINNVTQVLYGHTGVRVTTTARASARRLAGLSNTSTRAALTVRASVFSTELNVDVGGELFGGLRQFGPQGEALAQQYQVKDKHTTVAALGISYDPGQWFLMGELGRINTNSFLGNQTAGYLSGGYRYRNLTPYVVLSGVRANMQSTVAGLDLTGMPPPQAAAAGALNGGLNYLLSGMAQQRNASVGLRWDFRPDYAFTLQYDRLKPVHGSTGSLVNVQPGFRSGQAIGVFSAMVDFVF